MNLTTMTWNEWSEQTWDVFSGIGWDVMASIFWKNAVDNTWSTAGNWFNEAAASTAYGSAPTSGEHNIQYATGVTQEVTVAGALNLAITGTCGLSLNISGTCNNGRFTGVCQTSGTGAVYGGVFSAAFTNGATANIYGGVFTGAATNNGTLRGGVFTGAVTNANAIMSGWFMGGVTNNSGRTMYGGIVNGAITNAGTVTAGVLWWGSGRIAVNGVTYTASGTKPAAIISSVVVTTDNSQTQLEADQAGAPAAKRLVDTSIGGVAGTYTPPLRRIGVPGIG